MENEIHSEEFYPFEANRQRLPGYALAFLEELQGPLPLFIRENGRSRFHFEVEPTLRHATPGQSLFCIYFGFDPDMVWNPRADVLVFEPYAEAFKAVLEQVKLPFNSNSFQIVFDHSRFEYFFARFKSANPGFSLVVNTGYAARFPEAYFTFRQILQKAMPCFQLEPDWVFPKTLRSWWYSKEHVAVCPSTSHWRGRLKGLTAVIVGAGPSLDENLELLTELQDRVVIYAVSRVAKHLVQKGIRPHFIVHVEAQNFTRFLDDFEFPGSYFLLADQSHPLTIQACPDPYIFRSKQHPFSAYFARIHPELDKEIIPNGGSVASVAFSLACHAGCRTLILLGQDHAFPQRQSYANGCEHKARALPDNCIMVPAIGGGLVPSLPNYMNNVNWYVQTAKVLVSRGYELFNLGRSGALIKGFESISFAELSERLGREPVSFTPPDYFRSPPLDDRFAQGIQMALKRVESLIATWRAREAAFLERLDQEVLAEPMPSPLELDELSNLFHAECQFLASARPGQAPRLELARTLAALGSIEYKKQLLEKAML